MMKRERNNAIMLQCDNTGMRECFSAAMQECHRAWSMEHGARGKGEAAGFGWRRSHTIVPLEKGGGDFGAGGFFINNSLFLIAYFLFPENVKYRIRNHQSGIEGMTAMQECHRAWSVEHGAKGKGEAAGFGWRLSHTIVPLEKGGGDFGAGGLNRGHKRPAAKSQWSAYEIQFSRYPASGGTVIHGRRQLGPACCPLQFFLNNN